jgi:hypothetical protein
MKKLVREMVKNLIGATILGAIIIGFFALIGAIQEWLLADMGRFWLGMFIMVSFLAKALKEELNK